MGCLENPEAARSRTCNLQGLRVPSPGWHRIGKSACTWAPVNKRLVAKHALAVYFSALSEVG